MTYQTRSMSSNLSSDIVIIGGGGAGMAAAVAAAEKGARVIVLERTHKPLGSSGMAFGILGAASPVHKRLKMDASQDLLFKIAMDFSHWTVDAEIMRAFLEKSSDTIRWFEEKGVTFKIPKEEKEWFGQPAPLVWHCPSGYGAELLDVLNKNLTSLGGQVICDARATHILTDDKKGITGVLAERKGEDIKITASQVIIASGGYGSNKEMMQKYCPYYRENQYYEGFPAFGDGINMAMEIGAAAEGLGTVGLALNGLKGVPRTINDIAGLPDTIWLNIRGERFVDESAIHHRNPGASNPLLKQPETRHYTFLDRGILQHVLDDQGNNPQRFRDLSFSLRHDKHNAKTVPATGSMTSASFGPAGGSLDNVLNIAVDKGVLKISDSLEEMAAWMGCRPEKLRETVDEYNSYCDAKHDDAFLKPTQYLIPLGKQPYYAIKCFPRYLATMGGIRVNRDMQALDSEDNVIPGLYVTGVDVAGYEPDTYNALLHASYFGFAINSGRIAGEKAAENILKKN